MKTRVIGCDEAGRGAWAGPIVAAAVYFKKPLHHPWLRDSKKLTPRQREQMYVILQKHCAIGIAALSNRFIDSYGLQKANVLVVERALKELTSIYKPRATSYQLVIDYIGGFKRITQLKIPYSLHTRGESKFPEIAAASIIAKVYRDRLMCNYEKKFPCYYFQNTKVTVHQNTVAL